MVFVFLKEFNRIVGALVVIGILLCAAALDAQPRRGQRTVTELTDIVYSIRFSPDSRTVAIARKSGDIGRVELWDADTGVLRRVIRGFDGSVWSVSFAPDGKTLVTGSGGLHLTRIQQDSRRNQGKRFVELKWWDTETGELKQQMELPGEDPVRVMAMYSPDGRTLVTLEYRSPMIFTTFEDSGSFGEPGRFQSFPRQSSAILYDADMRILDARTGEVRLKIKGGINSYQSFGYGSRYAASDLFSNFMASSLRQPLAFSPDGQFVAVWNSKEVKIWKSETGEEVRKLKDFKGNLSAVAFSPDNRTLVAATSKVSFKNDQPVFRSEINLCNIASAARTQALAINTKSISSVSFAPNGRQLLIGGLQRESDQVFATLELFDLQNGSQGTLIAKDEGTTSSAVLSPDGAVLAFQTDASTVNLVDIQTWSIKHTFDATSDATSANKSIRRFLLSVKSVLALAFSSDGKTVSGEVEHDGIKVWDTRTGELKKEVTDHEDTNSIVGISSNATTAAEVGEENLRLWNVSSGEKKTVPTAGGSISAIALSSDGQTVAIAHPSQIILLNAGTGQLALALKAEQAQQSKISCMTFSADDRDLATAEDSRVAIWDLTTGQFKKMITSGGNVTALRFAPDGRSLASASQDGSVSLWDLQTGALRLHLKKHSAAVNAIAFSKAGDLMATGGDDRSVIIWDTATGKARRTLKGHDLTVTSLAFSSDTSLLASGSGNASVVLWDVATGKLNRVLK